MADDSDVPPLEDMTELLTQAEAIREKREINSDVGSNLRAKARAKVNKKVNAHVVKPESISGDDINTKTENHSKSQLQDTEIQVSKPEQKNTTKKSSNDGGFGGMKKGFLFGGSSSNKPKASNVISEARASDLEKRKPKPKEKKEEIPYIKPNGKTESGLTFDEVQTAMSEAKGLLDNQEWINDSLLDKVEKNEDLCKRFADPTFMKALEEFQTNPTAAMEKYKGNTEVEKFLQEFCGLLGDHFTHLADSSDTKTPTNNPYSSTSKSSNATANASVQSQNKPLKTSGPKIVELTDEDSEVTEKPAKKEKPKIVEITDGDKKKMSTNVIKLPGDVAANKKRSPDIVTHRPSHGADMQPMPTQTDEEVKQMLSDPKVMEVLMDPQVMQLIELLRNDPLKAQRAVDSADTDLKSKVRFLVSKGLLQFQTG